MRGGNTLNTTIPSNLNREFIDGAEAIARGALDAGCDFFAGYPITPASGVLMHMLRDLPKVGGIGIQGEDEIASIGFCIGAALGGAKPMTATSGPGLALYAENIGVSIMVEVPLVIVVVQRLGPATGAATAGAQGDVQFIRWGTSGGYPVIALVPTDAAECYHLTRRAFDLAQRFRVPVFLATDKEVVMTTETVRSDAFEAAPADWPAVPRDEVVPPLAPYNSPKSSPSAIRRWGKGEAGRRVDSFAQEPSNRPASPLHYTGSSHDEHGFITKDPQTLDRLNRHLAAKIEDHTDEIALVRSDLEAGARTLLLSYGVTARSMIEAVQMARERGQRVSALTIYSLWPVPEKAIRAALAGIDRVVVVELNLGQYRREIERIVGRSAEVAGVHRVDGELITPQQILAEVIA